MAGEATALVRDREETGDLTFLGILGREAMAEEFARADIYCLPSLAEGSATSIFEAMANGLPTVTTASSGSIIEDGAEGLIVPERNGLAIADAIERIVADRALRHAMSKAAVAAARRYDDRRAAAASLRSFANSPAATSRWGRAGRARRRTKLAELLPPEGGALRRPAGSLPLQLLGGTDRMDRIQILTSDMLLSLAPLVAMFVISVLASPLGSLSLPCMTMITSVFYFYIMPTFILIDGDYGFFGIYLTDLRAMHTAVLVYCLGAIAAFAMNWRVLNANPAASYPWDKKFNVPLYIVLWGMAVAGVIAQYVLGKLNITGNAEYRFASDNVLQNAFVTQALNLLIPLTAVQLIRDRFSPRSLLLFAAVLLVLLQAGFRFRIVILLATAAAVFAQQRGIKIGMVRGFFGICAACARSVDRSCSPLRTRHRPLASRPSGRNRCDEPLWRRNRDRLCARRCCRASAATAVAVCALDRGDSPLNSKLHMVR